MDENGGAKQLQLEPGDLLTLQEVAGLFRLTPAAVMKLKDREGLPTYHVGNRWLFDRREIAMWLAPRRVDVVKQ